MNGCADRYLQPTGSFGLRKLFPPDLEKHPQPQVLQGVPRPSMKADISTLLKSHPSVASQPQVAQPLSYQLLRRAGVADHVEFRDHQIVLGRGIASLVVIVARFLGNGAANGNPVTYVRSKRYVLALKIP
jgi:hypothetical protein